MSARALLLYVLRRCKHYNNQPRNIAAQIPIYKLSTTMPNTVQAGLRGKRLYTIGARLFEQRGESSCLVMSGSGILRTKLNYV